MLDAPLVRPDLPAPIKRQGHRPGANQVGVNGRPPRPREPANQEPLGLLNGFSRRSRFCHQRDDPQYVATTSRRACPSSAAMIARAA